MDANQTHFHLFFGYDNWAGCFGADQKDFRSHWEHSAPEETALSWDAKAGELTLTPQAFRFVPAKGDRAPTLADRRGSARDCYQNWYWISDDEKSIRIRSAGSDAVTQFW